MLLRCDDVHAASSSTHSTGATDCAATSDQISINNATQKIINSNGLNDTSTQRGSSRGRG